MSRSPEYYRIFTKNPERLTEHYRIIDWQTTLKRNG